MRMMRISWLVRSLALCFCFSWGCVLPQVASEDQHSPERPLCEDGAFSIPGSIGDPCSEFSLACDATLGRAVAQCERGAWKSCECLVPSADAATMARDNVTLPSAGSWSSPPTADPSKTTNAETAGEGGIEASASEGSAGSSGQDSLATAAAPTTPATPTTPVAGSPTGGSASSAGRSGAAGASGTWSAAAGSRGAAGRAGSSSTSWPAAGSSGVVALPRAGSSGASGSGAPPRRTSAGALAAGYGGSW